MARRSKKGRSLTGIVIVDKPQGDSSNFVLQRVKRLFDANKAGHTGSLDPLATGVLPICLGEATKLSTYLLDADKTYQVTCELGIATDSGDSDGTVIATQSIPEITSSVFEQILATFEGPQKQVPPMYSALKHQGQPLYKLARQGLEIERKARDIVIYRVALLALTARSFTLEVACSKGTYIRTLVQDIAIKLGTVGHVTMLRRTQAAGYDLSQAYTLTQLNDIAENGLIALDNCLLPAEEALPDWPIVQLDAEQTPRILSGQAIVTAYHQEATVRLFDAQNRFIGLGQRELDGRVAPKRLFVQS